VAASVAGLDTHVIEALGPLGGIDRKLVDIFLAAGGASWTGESVRIPTC
jgi:hypothetical protein